MQFDPAEHFENIVLPAIAAYKESEHALSDACEQNLPERELLGAKYKALREGGAAALYLHHFADIVANRGGPGLEDLHGKLEDTRRKIGDLCRRLHGEDDVPLLGAVADALKHAILTRGLPREVEEAGQVLVVDRPFGTGRFGEGKYGGTFEVWVLARSGRRPLSKVLDLVAAAWRCALKGERV